MSHSACRVWSKTLHTFLMGSMRNTLTSSHGKPTTSTPVVVATCRLSHSDNCRLGLYCDSRQKVCIQRKDVGAGCAADKE